MNQRPPWTSGGRLPRGCRAGVVTFGVLGVITLVLGGIGLASCQSLDLFGGGSCEDSDTELIRAAGEGDVEDVRAELDHGVDPDVGDGADERALRCAAERGDREVVDALLTAGADPDRRDEAGDTALLWAAQEGHADVVRALLDGGADPTVATDEGHRPLLRAAYAGQVAAIRALVEGGADVEAAGHLAPTAAGTGGFDFACYFAGEEVERIEPGEPPPDIVDVPTQEACQERREAAYPTLRRGPAEDVSALFGAVRGERPEAVRVLVELGAEVDAVAFDSYTPLYVAVAEDRPAVVQALLDAGADPTWRSPRSGLTAGEAAFALGNERVAALIDSAAL